MYISVVAVSLKKKTLQAIEDDNVVVLVVDAGDEITFARSVPIIGFPSLVLHSFFFNDPATTEIYTRKIVGSVRCV